MARVSQAAQIAALKDEVAGLRATVAKLEQRLGLTEAAMKTDREARVSGERALSQRLAQLAPKAG